MIMAKSRFRVTGFARFVLMLIIVTPLAYLGASYINGEDGIENLKNLFKGEQTTEEVKQPDAPLNDGEETQMPEAAKQNMAELERLKGELDYQSRLNQELKEENETLKRNLWEKDQEIARLKGSE